MKSCPYLLTSASALELYEGKVCSKSIQSYSEHRARCQGAREVPGRTWLGPAKQQMDFNQQTHFRDFCIQGPKAAPTSVGNSSMGLLLLQEPAVPSQKPRFWNHRCLFSR